MSKTTTTKTTTRYKPKRNYKRKTNKPYYAKDRKLICGEPKQQMWTNSSSYANLNPSTAPLSSQDITLMGTGDLLNLRSSPVFLNKSVSIRFGVVNLLPTARYFRISIIGLRGADSTADTTTWTDLLRNENFAAVSPAGIAGNRLLPINRALYKCYFDRSWRIPGTGDSTPNMVDINVYKKLNMITRYKYNSANNMDGSLWVVYQVYEEPGVSPQATAVNINYTIHLHGCEAKEEFK